MITCGEDMEPTNSLPNRSSEFLMMREIFHQDSVKLIICGLLHY